MRISSLFLHKALDAKNVNQIKKTTHISSTQALGELRK